MPNNIDANNVTVGKPKVTGSIFRAPLETNLPTDATTVLHESFVCLGYISDAGVVNTDSSESESVQAWGGDTVANPQGKKTDNFKWTMIEALNVEVLKTVYGKENVSGTLQDGITIKSNNAERENSCFVIDMILKNNTLKRIVIPNGKVVSVGDVTYVDNAPIGYETTVACEPDKDGNGHYEYIKQVTA